MVEISNRHLWRTEAGFWLMWILVEMSQPGVATSARWEKRWWQNGAAGGGVGGAPPPHSWAESSSDWPVLLSRANLTRRPHRPRRCHTEHSTTAITSKNHNRAKMFSREIYPVENLNRRSTSDDDICTFAHSALSWEMSTKHLENVKQLKTHLIFDIFRAFESVFYFDLMTFSLFQVCFKSSSNWEKIRPPLYLKWVQGKPQLLIDVKTFVHFGKLVEDAPIENAFWKLFQTNQRWLWWIMMIMADNFFSAFILTLKKEVLNVEAIE